jgi:DMSO/TMAO reductase YedYZ molybdopterin-dependent catalytic subunit
MLGKFFEKPSDDLADRVPPGQHLAKGFPVLTYGATQNISTDEFKFKVWGCATPKTFIWSDFMAMPQTDFTSDFHCVTTWSKLDVSWQGIKVTDFMKQVELLPTAVHLMQHAYGGYTTNLAIEDFLREENFFAHHLDGEPLSAEHGGPLRLIVPHLYAWKGAKWIRGIEFLDKSELGFWEQNGYHHRGDPFQRQRYA